jgi:hypothetical protein
MAVNMNPITNEVFRWLNSVVIGLNLCPFASKPTRENRVRFQISTATTEEQLLSELSDEMRLLDATPTAELETTLLIIPQLLGDFYDYHQFLGWAQANLKRDGWHGIYQLASFHPDYCFAGAEQDDPENLTNRAPYPIVHIIREQSLSAALNYVEDVEGIPERNKIRVAELNEAERRELFPYLFGINQS